MLDQQFQSEYLVSAIKEKLRADIKSKPMSVAEEVVDQAVEELTSEIVMSGTMFRDVMHQRDILKVIVDNRRVG